MSDNGLRTFREATSVVTGGASGIGRALGEELARRGSEVVLADLQIELAEEVAAGIRAAGGQANAHEVDVTDFSAVERLLRDTVARTGRLDYLFNNAGIGIGMGVGAPLRLHSIEDWNHIIDVNIRGEVHGVQAAYPIMLKQGFGHIVNTASMAGLVATAGTISYTTTKFAIVGMSKALRVEAAAAGIRVSVLCPGVVRTPLLDGGKYGKNLIEISPERRRALWDKTGALSPDLFARKALDAVARNQAIIILPGWWRLMWWVDRLFPALGTLMSRTAYRAMEAYQKGG